MGKNVLVGIGVFAVSVAVTLGVRKGVKFVIDKRNAKEYEEYEGAE